MGRIETFDNNSDLLGRIEHLKLNGVDEAQMLVISKENLDETLLSHLDVRRISTEVDTRGTGSSHGWQTRFRAMRSSAACRSRRLNRSGIRKRLKRGSSCSILKAVEG